MVDTCTSSSSKQREFYHSKDPDRQILCAVCDDSASGRHYGVFTCEGCKCFFSRVQRQKLALKCEMRGCCIVNKRLRKHCKACRFEKCCVVGMRREGNLSLSHISDFIFIPNYVTCSLGVVQSNYVFFHSVLLFSVSFSAVLICSVLSQFQCSVLIAGLCSVQSFFCSVLLFSFLFKCFARFSVFRSFLFCSVLYALPCSSLPYILLCLSCSAQFCSVLFSALLFSFLFNCSFLFSPCCYFLLRSVLFCSALFCSVLFCSVQFCFSLSVLVAPVCKGLTHQGHSRP